MRIANYEGTVNRKLQTSNLPETLNLKRETKKLHTITINQHRTCPIPRM